MSDINTSPVSLPAGSFDLGALQKDLDRAAKGSAKNYDDAVASALDKAADKVAEAQDARDIPGFKFVDVKRDDLGFTENVQVFDPKLAEKQEVTGDDREADLRNQQAEVTAEAVEKADSTSKGK